MTIGELVSDRSRAPIEEHKLDIPVGLLSQSPETTIAFSTEEAPRGESPQARFALQTFVLRRQP